MIKTISILGSTGSIGKQALDVASRLGIRPAALTACRSVSAMEEQVRRFSPALAVMTDEEAAKELRVRVKDTATRVESGMEGLCEAAQLPEAELVLNSVVGMVGLRPTLAAIHAGKRLALANKETLVTGGRLVTEAAKKAGVQILPVDSEHSAIFQCLQGCPSEKALKRILLTASGGPFFGKTKEELRNVTVEQALRHPNWSMGAKITVDSATMMNKGLELIEAVWLFGVEPSQVEIVVHRESVVHSLVEFTDNAVLAQLGVPDMRIPIQYAVTYPLRLESPAEQLSLADCGTLTFARPDYETFDALRACIGAIQKGGLAPAAANGANEQAVALFLNGKLPFLRIGELVEEAAERQSAGEIRTLEDVLAADRAAREFVLSHA